MRHEPVILIADSKEIFDEMMPVISKQLGTSHVIHVDSLDSAKSLIDAEIRFDIIFVDWQLVGAKFVDAIRNDKKNGCTPLVVMSDLDTDVVIATATRHGANGFLAKPFLMKGLLRKIEQVMAKQERRRNKRLCPDKTINISFDSERTGTIEGALIDFSLDYCHIRLDYSEREKMIIGDNAMVRLYIDSFKLDLESQLVRVEQDKKRADD
ncbi:MAG: response regulator, partial [Gammaproteobacteria bacterium]|nr:response regulator [Gammaproteobacteria bacterium]